MQNMTRTRGDTIELACEFSGDGNLKAKWLHLGQQWLVRRRNRGERISEFTSNSFSKKNPSGINLIDASANNEVNI